MTNFYEYQKMSEELKDNILEENRKLRRQISEKEQSFELVKSVHYDQSINLHTLNDIIVGCTGCLHSVIFCKNFEITNLEYSNPLFFEVMRYQKDFIPDDELHIAENTIPNYTLINYPIKSLDLLNDSKSQVSNIILLFPKRFIDQEALESVKSFMIITEVLINIVLTREKMIELIETDALTGVLNRTSWNRQLEFMKKIKGEQFILFLDIDRFKNINDTLGHERGDAVLKFIGIWLKNSFRILDKVFRLGGDEFCVIGQVEESYRDEFIKKIQGLSESFNHSAKKNLKMNLTISIGILVMKEYPFEHNIYAMVDELLYRSKNEGRNRVSIDYI